MRKPSPLQDVAYLRSTDTLLFTLRDGRKYTLPASIWRRCINPEDFTKQGLTCYTVRAPMDVVEGFEGVER